MVPVYLLTDAELAPGKRVSAGHVEFLPRADAEYCADRRLGLIYATCSVMKRWDSARGWIDPSSALVPLSPEVAERLESEGAVKILRDDAEVQKHKDIWAAHHQRFRELRDKARERHQEADRLGRDIGRSTFLPTFDWARSDSVSAG